MQRDGTSHHDYAYFERALQSRNFAAARAYAHGSRVRLPDGLALLLLPLDEPSASRDWYGIREAYGHRELAQVLEEWAERRDPP